MKTSTVEQHPRETDTRSALAIEIRGLSKSFGRTPVLRNLDLSVRWGHVVTVLGPNGSGKTTLLKVLATLTKPDSGSVRVGGLDLTRSGQRVRRLVGVVTHDSLLYDDLTAYENLRFAARMFGLDAIDQRLAAVAEQLGVSGRLHQRAGTLSHGLRKRFSIARALLPDPPILLMDEPESGLDQEALAMLEEVLSGGRTALVTTHSLERALALGDRMAILSRGRVAYEESLTTVGTEAMREAYFRHTGGDVP